MRDVADLLYIRGYLLTGSAISHPMPHWRRVLLSNYAFSYDPVNEFSRASEGASWVALLGTAIDTTSWSASLEDVAQKALSRVARGEDALFDYVDCLSGRFVMLYSDGSRTCLLTDACGLRSTFYAAPPYELVVSSHADLVRKVAGAGPAPYFDPAWLRLSSGYNLPGHLTPWDSVYYLTPNTLPELETRRVRRFFPRGHLRSVRSRRCCPSCRIYWPASCRCLPPGTS